MYRSSGGSRSKNVLPEAPLRFRSVRDDDGVKTCGRFDGRTGKPGGSARSVWLRARWILLRSQVLSLGMFVEMPTVGVLKNSRQRLLVREMD